LDRDRSGGQVIPDHEEGPTGHEELYVVINGHAFFKVGEEVIDGPTGTILLVRDPLMIRGATATNPGTTILTAGGAPGKAYTPHPWETNRDVLALFEVGDFGQARQYSPPHLRNTRSGRSCSTTSPAPRQSSATTTRRSATCQRRSAATLSSPNTRPLTPT